MKPTDKNTMQAGYTESDVMSAMALNEMQQFNSDENVLAAFKNVPTHSLKHVSDLIGYSRPSHPEDIEKGQHPTNPLEADYSLALLGYAVGASHAGTASDPEPVKSLSQWIRMVQSAGVESTVSMHLLLRELPGC